MRIRNDFEPITGMPIAAHFCFLFRSFCSLISINVFNVPNSVFISDFTIESSSREIFLSVSDAENIILKVRSSADIEDLQRIRSLNSYRRALLT